MLYLYDLCYMYNALVYQSRKLQRRHIMPIGQREGPLKTSIIRYGKWMHDYKTRSGIRQHI